MKRNDKDKRWDIGSGYYCDGYQRHKMKHWHTNEEARATDKLYNHRHHNNGWGDPDWSRIDRTLKQFHGKSYAAFRAYMESHVGYLKDKTGWNWEDHVVDDKNSSVRWAFEEDGVLKYPRGVKEPKHPDGVIKLAPKGKDIRYRFNPKVKNMFPWLSGFITNNVGVLHGGCGCHWGDVYFFEENLELAKSMIDPKDKHFRIETSTRYFYLSPYISRYEPEIGSHWQFSVSSIVQPEYKRRAPRKKRGPYHK